MMAKKKKEMASGTACPKVYESFGIPFINERDFNKAPSCFNGIIRIKKYRITIEELVEPITVLQERLEQLWVECDNRHYWEPLKNAAKELGYTFKGERGSAKKK